MAKWWISCWVGLSILRPDSVFCDTLLQVELQRERTALKGSSGGFWTNHMHWGGETVYFISMFFHGIPMRTGNMAHTNPLKFFLHFPQRKCCATTQMSTSSPGCWEKLRQGDWLLLLGDQRLDAISKLEASNTERKEVSDWYPKEDQKNQTTTKKTKTKNAALIDLLMRSELHVCFPYLLCWPTYEARCLTLYVNGKQAVLMVNFSFSQSGIWCFMLSLISRIQQADLPSYTLSVNWEETPWEFLVNQNSQIHVLSSRSV